MRHVMSESEYCQLVESHGGSADGLVEALNSVGFEIDTLADVTHARNGLTGDHIFVWVSADDLETKTVKQLLDIAAKFPDIKYESRMRKAQLIESIRKAQGDG